MPQNSETLWALIQARELLKNIRTFRLWRFPHCRLTRVPGRRDDRSSKFLISRAGATKVSHLWIKMIMIQGITQTISILALLTEVIISLKRPLQWKRREMCLWIKQLIRIKTILEIRTAVFHQQRHTITLREVLGLTLSLITRLSMIRPSLRDSTKMAVEVT